MIVINLQGGLGNQMFQYAFGRARALDRNEELLLDLGGLDHAVARGDTPRSYALGAFRIKGRVATSTDIKRARYPYGPLSTLGEILFKVARRLGIDTDALQARSSHRAYMSGYWQSPRYFAHHRTALLEELVLTHPPTGHLAHLAQQCGTRESVSIHVRRSDYLNPVTRHEFGICSLAYYREAIRLILEAHPRAEFFVFSDDPAWTSEHLDLAGRATIVSGTGLTDAEELWLMSQCKHNIIANSSFSWWGAYLNQHPTRTIIAPTPWFANAPYQKDLIPPTWITIPRE